MTPFRWGTMRIAAIPLTRGRPPIAFYDFKVQRPPAPLPPSPKDAPSPRKGWLPEQGIVKWATLKVDTTWASWGKAESGSWRFRVFEFGERVLDRVDFEEGALKSIDREHAPPPRVPEKLVGAEREAAVAAWAQIKVPLLYPPKVLSAPEALDDLRRLVNTRMPLHNRGVWTYLLIVPLTAPFMLIPIIPNLPFFFCAWRAWSHYQALQGARHVDGLLKAGKIVPQALTALDAVYEVAKREGEKEAPEEDASKDASKASSALIVTRESLGNAMRDLEMGPDETKEVLRAYEQAMNRTRTAS